MVESSSSFGNFSSQQNQFKEGTPHQFEQGGNNLKKGAVDVAEGTLKTGLNIADIARRCIVITANLAMSVANAFGGMYDMLIAKQSAYSFQKTYQQEHQDKFQKYEDGKTKRFGDAKQNLGDALKQTKKIFSKNIPNAGKNAYKLAVGSIEIGKGTFQVSKSAAQAVKNAIVKHRQNLGNDNKQPNKEITSIEYDNTSISNPGNNSMDASRRKLGFDVTGKAKNVPSTELGQNYAQELLSRNSSQRSLSK